VHTVTGLISERGSTCEPGPRARFEKRATETMKVKKKEGSGSQKRSTRDSKDLGRRNDLAERKT